MMRALDLHAVANGFRNRMAVETNANLRGQLRALSEYWEGKAREAEAERPDRLTPTRAHSPS